MELLLITEQTDTQGRNSDSFGFDNSALSSTWKIQCNDGQPLKPGIRANSQNVMCMKTYLQQYATLKVLTSS
jgi:hypothetical protein